MKELDCLETVVKALYQNKTKALEGIGLLMARVANWNSSISAIPDPNHPVGSVTILPPVKEDDNQGEGNIIVAEDTKISCSTCGVLYEVTRDIRDRNVGTNYLINSYHPVREGVPELTRDMLNAINNESGWCIDCPVCNGVKTLVIMPKVNYQPPKDVPHRPKAIDGVRTIRGV